MMNILAAFIFFTRFSFWKLKEVPAENFKNIIAWWPLVGWLTGGTTALILWLMSMLFPMNVAVLLALVWRLLITGALHEDGLADFFDGFGGGTTCERILAIMKDSSIGSYGVLALIVYFFLLWSLLTSIPVYLGVFVIAAGDIWSKATAAQLSNLLPYARNVEESKSKIIYNRMSLLVILRTFVIGLLPLFVFLPAKLWLAALMPVGMLFILYRIMKRRLQGYTGDCCGATFLLCELSFYLGAVLIFQLWL